MPRPRTQAERYPREREDAEDGLEAEARERAPERRRGAGGIVDDAEIVASMAQCRADAPHEQRFIHEHTRQHAESSDTPSAGENLSERQEDNEERDNHHAHRAIVHERAKTRRERRVRNCRGSVHVGSQA